MAASWGVEGTGLDQGFDQTPVQRAQRHTTNEVHEVHELAPRTAAFGDDIGHRLIADVTDCAQAETDDVADGGVLQYRFVHIGRQHLDAHTPGLAQIQRRLVLVRAFVLQQGRHELHRIVGLQIRGPVGDQTVCGGMRFVERVPGERHEDVPDGLGRLLGITVLLHTGEERHLLLGQHLGLLFAHGSAQHVGSAERVASQDTRGRLHLLLIHDQAIGLVQHGGQRLGHLRVDRGDLLQAVLTLGVVVVRIDIHRARSIQGDQCRDVVEVIRLEAFEQRPHAVGIELEDAQRIAARQQLVGLLVVQRNLSVVDGRLTVAFDVAQRIPDDREIGQAQEVHLDQTQRFAGVATCR